MKITIDAEPPVTMQPDTLTWQPPREIGSSGEGSPVIGPTWRCSLGFSVMSWPYYQQWFDAWDGELHDITLPHPSTGEMTSYSCYIRSISPRMMTKACKGVVSGVDIVLSKIQVD